VSDVVSRPFPPGRAAGAARELLERGYTVFERIYSADEVDFIRDRLTLAYDRLGRPRLSANPPSYPAPDVEIGPPGLVLFRLASQFPELASRLYKAPVIDAIRAVLGDDMHLEQAAGVLSDSTRPFFDWHVHTGGADGEYYGHKRVYTRFQRSERVTTLLYLDDITEQAGELLVYPRKLTDPTEPPLRETLESWPGQVEIRCPRGSMVVLEQCTWHAARRKESPGIRAFVGSYFAARGAVASPLFDDTLRSWSGDDVLFGSLLPAGEGTRSTTPARPAR
jgi:hypothetical protein